MEHTTGSPRNGLKLPHGPCLAWPRHGMAKELRMLLRHPDNLEESHLLVRNNLPGSTAALKRAGEEEMTDEDAMSKELKEQRKIAERSLYNSFNVYMNAQEFGPTAFFLNYGYVPNSEPQYARVEPPSGDRNLQSIRLVLETIGDCPLDGKDILDVGCGRGGTISTIKEFFDAGTLVGVDLSPEAIAFCQTRHSGDNVSFIEGDAEDLPLPEHSFDVVVNIESACNYPNIFAFYREAARVLRPGGYFLYADVVAAKSLDSRFEFLQQFFTIEKFRDITSNVLLSCDEIAAGRLSRISGLEKQKFMAGIQHDSKPKDYEKLISQMLCVPGSKNYNRMRDGADVYLIIKSRKK